MLESDTNPEILADHSALHQGKGGFFGEMPAYLKPAAQERGNLVTYFNLISHYPLLTREEELELSRSAKNGSESAFNCLVASNLRLVIQVAKRFRGRGLELEDLIQEGNLGLIRAAQLFDPERGNRFSTYATRWIVQKISRAVDNHSRTIRVPISVHQSIRAVLRAKSQFLQAEGVEPGLDELARITGLSRERIDSLEEHMSQALSLNQEKFKEEGAELLEDVSTSSSTVEEEVDREIETRMIRKMMNVLTPLERTVTYYRYGLFGLPDLSYEQLSEELDMPKRLLRNAFKRAMSKLRKQAEKSSLKDDAELFDYY